ncbi:hypothetical protein [Pseudomonas asiatica]|uniref:hypothetical protein n=1 Tax=Pseudomonas asiatica TaxID=2219225 RepID=UPI0010C09290|nr:hypothetical protein [Pseudomonas asiatica]EKT4528340.1 hypothetical protein [Pseudomonas putida]
MPKTIQALFGKMLADRGDFPPGLGEQILLEVAAAYLDGREHNLVLMAGQVVIESLSPAGRGRDVRIEPRLSVQVMAAGIHDLMGDKPLAVDHNLNMVRYFAGYRCRLTVFPVGLIGGGLEVSLRVLGFS